MNRIGLIERRLPMDTSNNDRNNHTNLLCMLCRRNERERPYRLICSECFTRYKKETKGEIPIADWVIAKAKCLLEQLLVQVQTVQADINQIQKAARREALQEPNPKHYIELEDFQQAVIDKEKEIAREKGIQPLLQKRTRLARTAIYVAGTLSSTLQREETEK